jgi:tRNA threonylcarbamoyladenosine biosynthesis protein TsaE
MDSGGGPRILCLYGQLGSGKTTFTQGFARGLGITSRLLSPTFIIVRRYDIPSSEQFLYHIDLYRLKNVTEMEELGLDEIFTDLRSYVVIEWAEKLGELLPKHRIDIRFTVVDYGKHKITITKGN